MRLAALLLAAIPAILAGCDAASPRASLDVSALVAHREAMTARLADLDVEERDVRARLAKLRGELERLDNPGFFADSIEGLRRRELALDGLLNFAIPMQRQGARQRRAMADTLLALHARAPGRFALDRLDPARRDWGVAAVAKADVAAGRFNVLTAGFSVFAARPERTARLTEQLGIEIHDIAGDGAGDAPGKFAAGYNAISRPAIDARFGADAVDRVMAENPSPGDGP